MHYGKWMFWVVSLHTGYVLTNICRTGTSSAGGKPCPIQREWLTGTWLLMRGQKELRLTNQSQPSSPPWCIGEWRSGHCRRLRSKSAILLGVQAQLHWELCVVPLVRVLDLSPDCRSALGVLLWWLGLVSLTRAFSHFLRFCVCSSLPRQRRGFFVQKTHFWLRADYCVTCVQKKKRQQERGTLDRLIAQWEDQSKGPWVGERGCGSSNACCNRSTTC